MDIKKFERDLETIIQRVAVGENNELVERLQKIKMRLVGLYTMNLVKINHSALELLCAKNLLKLGYDAQVEKKVGGGLVCDVFGNKGDGKLIVEIETGYVPPANALSPSQYCDARILSKVARYSEFAEKFALATTPSNLLNIPKLYTEPPRVRSVDEAAKLKGLCDIYYNKPSVTLEQIIYGKVHSVYILDLDRMTVSELSPESYVEAVSSLPFRKG